MTTQVHIKLRKLRQVSPNSPQSKSVRAIIEDEFGYDFDPLIELVKIAKTTNNDMVAAQCYAQVCKFCYPQLKATEITESSVTYTPLNDSELANRFNKFVKNKERKNGD